MTTLLATPDAPPPFDIHAQPTWIALVRDATESLAQSLDLRLGDVSGACLFASAVLARHLADRGIDAIAVNGEFDGEPHWWLTVGGVRLDATRSQFDDGPAVTPLEPGEDDYIPYLDRESWPARWTHEQVLQEAARSFGSPSEGAVLAGALLAELDDLQPKEEEAR